MAKTPLDQRYDSPVGIRNHNYFFHITKVRGLLAKFERLSFQRGPDAIADRRPSQLAIVIQGVSAE